MKALEHRRIVPAWLVGAIAAFILLPVLPARGGVYTGFKDAGDFEGSIATIEYVATTVVAHVAVWTGIDDGAWLAWYQAGWRQNAGEAPTLYLEWIDGNQNYQFVATGTPPASGDYSVSRNGSNVDLLAGNALVRSVAWVEAIYCWAAFLVELHNEGGGDKTPGTASGEKLDFSGCQYISRTNFSWKNAGLKYEPSSASANGVASAAGNSFYVYDTRP